MTLRVLISNSTLPLQPEWRALLNVYLLTMIFLAVLGNSLVVYATSKFNAIHLDSGSVLLVQNLALTDMSLIVVAYVPKVLTLLVGSWVLGPMLCYITAFLQFIPGAGEILTLTCIAGYRCFLVRFPFRAHPKVSSTKLLICLIWISACVSPVVFMSANKSQAIFDIRTLGCVTNVALHHKSLVLFVLFAFGIIPVLLTVMFNLYTLLLSVRYTSCQKKGRASPRSHNRQAVVSGPLS